MIADAGPVFLLLPGCFKRLERNVAAPEACVVQLVGALSEGVTDGKALDPVVGFGGGRRDDDIAAQDANSSLAAATPARQAWRLPCPHRVSGKCLRVLRVLRSCLLLLCGAGGRRSLRLLINKYYNRMYTECQD